jgi:DNA-binding NarL/FixJ family response regulator
MVVENDVFTRVRLKSNILLSGDIIVVGEASNSEDALRLADELLPDVVIMDVNMPSDSSEVAREIISKHKNIGMIMLALQKDENDIFASLAAGVTGYGMKDAGADHLHTAIRSVYAGDTWIDAENASRMLLNYKKDKPNPVGSSIELVRSTFFAGADRPVLREVEEFEIHEIDPEPLSPRELEVVNLIVQGLTNRDIADKLIVSLATAKSHVRNVLNKFAVTNRTQAAICAMKQGIVYAKPQSALSHLPSEYEPLQKLGS